MKWFAWLVPISGRHRLPRWFAGLIVLAIDITPLNLVYETILDFLKNKTRPLSSHEIEIAFSVFGKSLPYHNIGIDPRSIPAIKKKTMAYVSFYTINFADAIPDTTLVHEMMHVWQYEMYGAVYITEAFWAQRWGGGYNYGGLGSLKMHCDDLCLQAFNFEQQADIIEDYFRWKNNLPLQWSINVPGVGEVFELYRESLKA